MVRRVRGAGGRWEEALPPVPRPGQPPSSERTVVEVCCVLYFFIVIPSSSAPLNFQREAGSEIRSASEAFTIT